MRDSATKAPAAEQQAPSSLWPPQLADTSCPRNKQNKKGKRLKVLPPRAHYPDRRVVTSAGLALRRVWRVRDIDRSRQGGNRRITLWPNPLTRPKPWGLLSGTTIRDTLIGVLRSLYNAKHMLRQPGTRRPAASFQPGKKQWTQRSTACGPFASPSNPRNDLHHARGSL